LWIANATEGDKHDKKANRPIKAMVGKARCVVLVSKK